MKTTTPAPGVEGQPKKKAVSYSRVSTPAQEANGSFERQRRAHRRWGRKHGVIVSKPFRDCASGKTLDRPGLNAAMQEIKTVAAAFLLVEKIDRLTRNPSDLIRVKRELEKIGAEVRSATEAVNETPEGQRLAAALVLLSATENNARSALKIEARKRSARRGRHTGKAPLGFLKTSRIPGAASMEIDRDKQAWIRWAFEAAASGISQAEILAVLRLARGFKNPQDPLSQQVLSSMLRNPVYCGRLSIPKWGIDVQGDWPPIITQGLFDRVQKAIGNNRPKAGAKSKAPNNANVPEAV